MSGVTPPHLQAFILRHLPSVAHLDALLWLREHRTRWWHAESLASSLGIPCQMAEKILEELCAGSLLAVQVSSAVVYQFNPATAALEDHVSQFIEYLRCSREHVDALIATSAVRSSG